MSNFAKLQLLKYGWSEGKGLGKNENGIVSAIKPKLKFDTTGIGHDGSEYRWWEDAYNKASNNLNIKSNFEEVKFDVKDTDAVEIATSKSELTMKKMKKSHNLEYGSFIKTSTIQNGKDVKNYDYAENFSHEELELPVLLTDEQLLQACGGRTAHKGARHGLKLSGKLARIEQQEQKLLLQNNSASACSDWIQVDVKRKKKRKFEKMNFDDTTTQNEDIPVNSQSSASDFITTDIFDDFVKPKSQKSRRKEKRKFEYLTHKLSTSLALSEDSGVKKKKRHKHSFDEKHCTSKLSEEFTLEKNNSMLFTGTDDGVVKDITCNDDGFVSEDNSTEPLPNHSEETKRLNHKIKKRKKKKIEKQQRKKLQKLSETLETLNLESDIRKIKKI